MIFCNIRRRSRDRPGPWSRVPVPVKILVPVPVKNRPGPGPLKVKIWGIKNDIFIEIFIFKKNFSGAFGAKGVKYTSKFLKIVFCQNTSNFSDEKSAKKSIFLTSTRYYWGLVPVPDFSGPGPGGFLVPVDPCAEVAVKNFTQKENVIKHFFWWPHGGMVPQIFGQWGGGKLPQ